MGTFDTALVPEPSAPVEPSPQQYADPDCVTPQALDWPTLTWMNGSWAGRWPREVVVGDVAFGAKPMPNCPSPFDPHPTPGGFVAEAGGAAVTDQPDTAAAIMTTTATRATRRCLLTMSRVSGGA